MWKKIFGKYLLVTNTVSSGLLFSIGDAIQQNVEFSKGTHLSNKYDWHRTGKFFIVGLSQGPPHHFFYRWLDRVCPGKTKAIVLKKILIDQVLGAPYFAFIFFGVAGALERKSLPEIVDETKRKFPTVYLFDWVLWPPAQYINFYFIPSRFRVLYVNGVTVLWDVFLSYIKHFDQH